jgi:hypothetical protein
MSRTTATAAPELARPPTDYLEQAFPPPEPAGGSVAIIVQARNGSRHDDGPALERALRDAGLGGLSGVEFIHCRNLVRPRLARDVPWTDYPIVGGPYWKVGDMALGADPGKTGETDLRGDAVAALSRASAWVTTLFVGDEDMPVGLHRLARLLRPERMPRVMFWNSGKMGNWDEAMADAGRRDARLAPVDRFL